MKLSDLENGAVVELRNGQRYLKVDNTFLELHMKGNFMKVDDYNEDFRFLTSDGYDEYDIVKVAMVKEDSRYKNLSLWYAFNDQWVWEREEPILTDEERDYLFNVIKPFKEQVIAIKKVRYGDLSHEADFIKIICKSITKGLNCETIDFITFEKGSKYKGMDYDYEYTLDQLGLN